MAEKAKVIHLQITPEGATLMVNGTEFPFDIAAEDIVVQGASGGPTFARVSILAEAVIVTADLGPVEQPEEEPDVRV